jgi:hypothetical protein
MEAILYFLAIIFLQNLTTLSLVVLNTLQTLFKVYRIGIFSIQTSITFSNNTKLKTENRKIEKESEQKKRQPLGRPWTDQPSSHQTSPTLPP